MASRFSKHAMIGEGGNVRVPRSESGEIDRVIALLKNGNDDDISESLEILERLRNQVSAGYHRNPGSNVYAPMKMFGVISNDVRSVAYRHAKDSKLYKHDFERNSAEAIAMIRHGKHDLLITSPDGLPLWDEF